MSKFFQNFKSESQKRGSRAPMKPRRLATETLEDRRLLAVSPEILTALNGYESFGEYSADSVSTIEIAGDALTLDALNDAISQAASTPGDDAILIVGGGTLTFQPGDKAIMLELDDATQGALTIVGYGGTFEIDAASVDRAFSIKSGTVKLGSVEISNGQADFGGAIANAGDLYLEDAILSNNVATVGGGAIADKGWISVENSRIVANEAAESGAAIYRGDFEFAQEENDAVPEATETIADVEAGFGETVEIELSDYFSEGDWTYSVKLPETLSDALADEPIVDGSVLRLQFVDQETYLERVKFQSGYETFLSYAGLAFDLSAVELVVSASNADGTASADSNVFSVGLTSEARYSLRLTAVLTSKSADDVAEEYEQGSRREGYFYGADEVPESDATSSEAPLALQLWAEDLSHNQGLELEGNVGFVFVVKIENGKFDLVRNAKGDAYEDGGYYAELDDAYYMESYTDYVIKTAEDGGVYAQKLGENEYWISFLCADVEAHGTKSAATLLAYLPIVPTGEGDVSVSIEPSFDYESDPVVLRYYDDAQPLKVDSSQVEFVNATTAASSAAVLSNAELAAATTETRAAVLRDVLIAGNSGGQGAIYVAAGSSAALLVNATVVDNAVQGAAFVSAATGSQAVDSIFVGNGAAVSGVALQTSLTDDGAEGALAYDASKPLFADAENGDYSLAKNAQVLDLATGTAASEIDLAGNARVSGAAADLGAYEYQGAAPAAPTDLAMTNYDGAKKTATLTWTDVADDETGYLVESSTDGGKTWKKLTTLAADSTKRACSGLNPGSTYMYRLAATNAYGTSVWATITFEAPSVPLAPTGLILSDYDAASAKLTMKWTDNADDETAYVVVYALVGSENWETQNLAADATGCRFTSVDPSKSYVFRVYASNAAGDSDYIEATFNASTDVLTGLSFSTDAPKVGEELTITVAPTTALVALQWFRVDASGQETAIDGATAATYVPTTADLGATLKVVATGLNAAYASTVSATSGVVGETATIPAAPTDAAFGAYDADSQSAELTWVDVADNETGYRVEVKNADGSWTVVATLDADATSCVVEGLGAGTVAEYRVVAFNAAGDSEAATAMIGTAPSAPTGLTMKDYDAPKKTATLVWNDVEGETKYLVQSSTDGGETWNKLADLGANVSSRLCAALTPGKTFIYRVAAANDYGTSEWAEIVFDAPNVDDPQPATPAAPSNIVFGVYDSTTHTLPMSWTDNSDDETAFVVEYSVDGGAHWLSAATMKADVAERVATRVWENFDYRFRVCARNANGQSDWTYASFGAAADALTAPSFSTAAPAPDEAIAAVFDSAEANATFQWYRVEADGSETLLEGATNAEYLPTVADVGFRLKVVATSANPAYSSTASAVSEVVLETARFVPTAPTNLVFSDYDPATQLMTMTWEDNSINETYFQIEYRKDAGGSAGIWRPSSELGENPLTVGRDVESRVCNRVNDYTRYDFRVRAVYEYVDENGETVKLTSDWAEATFQVARDVVPSVELSTDAPQVGVEIAASIPDHVVDQSQGGEQVSVDATFQWYRVVEGVATAIEGATSATYVPTLDDVGCQLRAVATSVNAAYVSSACATTAEIVGEIAGSRPVPPSDVVFGQYDPETKTIEMSWTNNSETATRVIVEYYRAVSDEWIVSGILNADATGRVATGIKADTLYQFRVKAISGAGESVYATASFDARRDVLEGASFTCEIPTVGEATQVVLDGARNDATFQWFRVDADGNETAIEGATTAVYVPTASDVGFALKVVATAANAAYDSQISVVTEIVVATPSVPNAPTNVAFGEYDAATKRVELTWVDASNNETGFYVEYSVDGGKTWLASETMGANETSRSAWGLRSGTTYQFRVAAFNTAGVSEWSVASFEVPAPAASAAVLETAFESDDLVDELLDELDDFFATLD